MPEVSNEKQGLLFWTGPWAIWAYLQFRNLIVSLLEFNLSEVSVQPVHLVRVRHWMDSQSLLEQFTLFFTWIRVFSQLIMVVLNSLKEKGNVYS